MSEEQSKNQPPPDPVEITLSSEYYESSDELRVLAKLKVESMMDGLSRMNMVELLLKSVVEKIANEYVANWSDEVFDKLDADEIVKMVKDRIAEKMTERLGNTMAQVLAKARKEDGEKT